MVRITELFSPQSFGRMKSPDNHRHSMHKYSKTPLLILAGMILSFSASAEAVRCEGEWLHPSSQAMSMDATVSFALSDYKNGERHFSAQQGPGQSLDIYYLKGGVLVKGYSQAQLAQLPQAVLFMMPMTFAVPATILSQAAPEGPCKIVPKAKFSLPLTAPLRLQDRALTSAAGQLSRSASDQISYDLDVVIDPPAPNKTSVRYAGTMSFTPEQEALPDDLDISGYLLVMRSGAPVATGSEGIPVTLGELRRSLALQRDGAKP
jgi:hypothetical protein